MVFDRTENNCCYAWQSGIHPQEDGEMIQVDGKIQKKQVSGDSGSHPGNILFVDDDLDIAQVSKRVLENLGYRVTIRNNADEALQLFSRQPYGFDLVVTDLMMPEMDGLELSRRIINIRMDIPIIISTGYSENILDMENLPDSVTGILPKPATIAEIKAAVRLAMQVSI